MCQKNRDQLENDIDKVAGLLRQVRLNNANDRITDPQRVLLTDKIQEIQFTLTQDASTQPVNDLSILAGH